MSADDNLRDALIEAFDVAFHSYRESHNHDLTSDEMADIALKVIKDWTSDEPGLKT